MLKFIRLDDIVGRESHRSGWPYAISQIIHLNSDEGLAFDDFAERSFSYRKGKSPYLKPWACVFHHPEVVEKWLGPEHSLDYIFSTDFWKRSVPSLRFAFCLSKPLKKFLEDRLQIPVYFAWHPTEPAIVNSKCDKIVQIGNFLRNTDLIRQFQCNLPKYELESNLDWVSRHKARVTSMWKRLDSREHFEDVEKLPHASNNSYDNILATSVICSEYFSAAASNLVVECAVRNTPLLTNRLPCTEDYLGKDYPLFFNDVREIPELLSPENLDATRKYLQTIDKTRFLGSTFAATVEKAVFEQCA